MPNYDSERVPEFLRDIEAGGENESSDALSKPTAAEKRGKEKGWQKKKRMAQVSYLLTPEIKRRVEALAEQHNASRSEIARLLLEIALNMVEQEKLIIMKETVEETRSIVREATDFF